MESYAAMGHTSSAKNCAKVKPSANEIITTKHENSICTFVWHFGNKLTSHKAHRRRSIYLRFECLFHMYREYQGLVLNLQFTLMQLNLTLFFAG